METQYINEHISAGLAGRAFLWMALIAGIISIFYYLIICRKVDLACKFRVQARLAFSIHFVSLLLAAATLYYLIFNHYYEYRYVYQYTSNELPFKYLISSFWAGQEGSMLLWLIFQAFLGFFTFKAMRQHEPWVMITMLISQLVMLSSLLGINFLHWNFGSDLFQLLRQVPENAENPFFSNPDYQLVNGNGLNPLLTNPWMVIHPPVLFLGYAASLFIFGFAVSAALGRNAANWNIKVFPWLTFAMTALGAGLFLGGVWAYKDLTFGGFWAWDPVENASLVPWLILLAALHLLLIQRNRNALPRFTLFILTLPYLFVVYAAFLTRSGILGNTSVHAFSGSYMSLHLALFLAVFLLLSLITWTVNFFRYKSTDKIIFPTRNFILFSAALLLLLSAFQIITTTSLPLINALFNTHFSPPLQREVYYNQWQIVFAGLFSLVLLLDLWSSDNWGIRKIFKVKTLIVIVLSLALTGFIWNYFKPWKTIHIVVLFIETLLFFSSLISIYRPRFKNSPSISSLITHMGISVFIIGILIAFGHSKILTANQEAGSAKTNETQLFLKGEPKKAGHFEVIFAGFIPDGNTIKYALAFYSPGNNQMMEHQFTLFPYTKTGSPMGEVYVPATKNILGSDIFCWVPYAEVNYMAQDSIKLIGKREITQNQTISMGVISIRLDSFQVISQGEKIDPNNVSVTAFLQVSIADAKTENLSIQYIIENGTLNTVPARLTRPPLKITFDEISQKPKTIKISVFEPKAEFVAAKIIYFPMIILVWSGGIIILVGMAWGIFKRRNPKKSELPDAANFNW